MAVSVNDIISQAAAYSANNEKITNSIVATNNARITAANAQAGNYDRLSALDYSNTLQKEQAELETQQLNLKHAQALGVGGANDILMPMLEQLRGDFAAMRAAEDKVTELEKNSDLLANPLGWLTDLLTGDEIRAERDGLVRKAATTADAVQKMNDLTQENVATNNLLKQTRTAKSIKDTAEAASITAANLAEAARTDAASYAMVGLDALQKLGSTKFNTLLQVRNVEMDQLNYEARQTEIAARSKEYALRVKDLADKEAVETEIVEDVSNYLGTVGASMSRARILAEHGAPGKVGDFVRKAAALGQQGRMSGSMVLGTTPAESYFTLLDTGRPFPEKLHKDVVDVMETTGSELVKLQEQARSGAFDNVSTKVTVDKKGRPLPIPGYGLNSKNWNDEATRDNVYNQIANEKFKGASQIRVALPLDFESIVAANPAIADTALYTSVVAPLLESGVKGLAIKDLVLKTASKVSSGGISPNEAAANIRAIAQTDLDIFNASSGVLSVGAPAQLNLNLSFTKKSDVGAGFAGVLGSAVGNLQKASIAAALRVSMAQAHVGLGERVASLLQDREIVVNNETDLTHFFQGYRAAEIADKTKAASDEAKR